MNNKSLMDSFIRELGVTLPKCKNGECSDLEALRILGQRQLDKISTPNVSTDDIKADGDAFTRLFKSL